ncbi:DeoR/GlpR family DNA-binding transcription regulator [Pontibacillus yanchengensis]|uniref:DeoR faimly transcriptional regulator n=1 Tax=Pontibacillus yanchengensis Y32 TaxID=1385514 RepID=A0A0A2TC60_9BACI|nr:DeoR/GlpR family DNA-binding transcription regulator [Pontibacillus yanchengensis]KGP72013.1 DeoR faimly transcriptional regulator [Pontibacillus yanchengensis Y32]
MLTPQRQQLILDLLHDQQTVKLHEFVQATNASESTIRRDLQQLEEKNLLKRVHGGASILHQKREELSIPEKSTKNLQQKKQIAMLAASFIRDGDCVFLDAGTTTYEMIPYMKDKHLTVVTNGLSLIDALIDHNIEAYVTGGFVKHKTRALIGSGATSGLTNYRFDKSFLGVNGIHPFYGYTTPDPEEAVVKSTALAYSQEAFILGDSSKLNEVTFSKVADLDMAQLITNEENEDRISLYKEKTTVKVVSP